jgi:hypothetical protein
MMIPILRRLSPGLRLAAGTLASLLLSGVARAADEVMDLGADSADTFTPYLYERHPAWALLPIFMIGAVLLHLRKNKLRTKPTLTLKEPK